MDTLQKLFSSSYLLALLGISFSVNAAAPDAPNAAMGNVNAMPGFAQDAQGNTQANDVVSELTPINQYNATPNPTPQAPLNLPPVSDNSGMNAQQQNYSQQLQNLPPDIALQQMEMMAPQATPRTFGTVNDPAFQNVLKKQFPLTPDQIIRLREVMQDTQRATGAPLQPPTPTVSTQTVSLSPGTIPPVIRLATGYVSSIVFVDETGSPLAYRGL